MKTPHEYILEKYGAGAQLMGNNYMVCHPTVTSRSPLCFSVQFVRTANDFNQTVLLNINQEGDASTYTIISNVNTSGDEQNFVQTGISSTDVIRIFENGDMRLIQ